MSSTWGKGRSRVEETKLYSPHPSSGTTEKCTKIAFENGFAKVLYFGEDKREIRGIEESDEYQVRAKMMKNLRINQQGIPETMLSFVHLKDLCKKEVCFESVCPEIFIFTYHWEYTFSRKLRVGKPNKPDASKTRLSWVLRSRWCATNSWNNDMCPTRQKRFPRSSVDTLQDRGIGN